MDAFGFVCCGNSCVCMPTRHCIKLNIFAGIAKTENKFKKAPILILPKKKKKRRKQRTTFSVIFIVGSTKRRILFGDNKKCSRNVSLTCTIREKDVHLSEFLWWNAIMVETEQPNSSSRKSQKCYYFIVCLSCDKYYRYRWQCWCQSMATF